eukprot:scaffold93099_cov12-Tisochrysis_lutea.AAC.1
MPLVFWTSNGTAVTSLDQMRWQGWWALPCWRCAVSNILWNSAQLSKSVDTVYKFAYELTWPCCQVLKQPFSIEIPYAATKKTLMNVTWRQVLCAIKVHLVWMVTPEEQKAKKETMGHKSRMPATYAGQ